MIKLTFILAAASIALSASSQLKVVESGQVQVGNFESSLPILGAANDTVATVRIGGKGNYSSGGRLSFGLGHAYIEEGNYTGTALSGRAGGLRISGGPGGFFLYSGNRMIFSYDPFRFVLGTSNPTLSSSVVVSAPQYLTTSDARAKTNIEPLEDMGELLGNVAPISYKLVANVESSANDSQKSKANQGHSQYGFLAQNVREVYPDLVYEDSEGMLSIDYTGFIAILVDAVQNLQSQVREQAETIETLKNGSKDKTPGGDGTVVASLSQNRPNPFRATTVISCVVPEGVTEAFLCVYDLNGNQKLRKNIPTRGNVDITIDGSTLNAGMYIYTLITDGLEVDSKRMILTD